MICLELTRGELQNFGCVRREFVNLNLTTGRVLIASKNGARCRFRTCDPYRVKVMLYH